MQRYQRPKIANNILETIGNTPLVRLNKLSKDVQAQILLKLEFFNPLSSVVASYLYILCALRI